MNEESWEEFYHVHYCDNGKQEGFVALLLMILTKKSMFKNGENRTISPKTKKTLPVHVTHGIYGMSTYDPLRAILLVKGEKQRLLGKNCSAVFSRKESFRSFLLPIQSTRRSSEPILN